MELAELLELPVKNPKHATLAAHWSIARHRLHDAIVDARLLAELLPRCLEQEEAAGVELLIRKRLSAAIVGHPVGL